MEIYAFRPSPMMVAKYLVIEENKDSYILKDTTCKHYDENCKIQISKEDLSFLCAVNESAQEFIYSHKDNIFFKDEDKAKRFFYTKVISMAREELEKTNNNLSIIKESIEKLEKKANKKIDKVFELEYGIKIYTFNTIKLNEKIQEIKENPNFDIEKLSEFVDEFKINSLIQTYSIKNDIKTETISYYVDERRNEDSTNKNEIYFKIRKLNDYMEINSETFITYSDYESDENYFCDKYSFGNMRAYKTKKQCLTAIYQYILKELQFYEICYNDTIKKYSKMLDEYQGKLSALS